MTCFPLARIVRDVVVYEPVPWILRAYAWVCKEKAVLARAQFEIKREHANFVIMNELSKHHDLQDKIEAVKTRIRIRTRGVAFTEAYEPEDELPLNQMSDSDRLILKKAWKLVASKCHPDKGGDADTFQFMKEAYQAGDLRTLTEYVISHEKTVLEQIEYWITEALRPAHNWQILQHMDQFQVLKAAMSGRREEASRLARRILENMLVSLEHEELMMED